MAAQLEPVMEAPKKKVKKLEIFGYGFGGLGANLLLMVCSNYIMYFFTDVAGITVGMAGLIYAITQITDAITDPLMGTIADRTTGRFGRMRPYMMFGSFIAGIVLVMLFTTVGFGEPGKSIYYLIFYILWAISYTVVTTPYQSSPSIVTRDKRTRNFLVMSGKLVAIPAGLVVANMHGITRALGGGNDNLGWQRAAMVFAAVVVVSMFICAFSTRRFDTQEAAKRDAVTAGGEKFTMKQRIKVVTGNKALLLLVVAFGTNSLALAATQSVQNYYAKYVLENLSFISVTGNIASVLMIPMFACVPFLCKKFAKRSLFIVGTVLHIIPAVVILVMGLNASALMPLAIVMMVVSSASGFFCNILAYMMLLDCVDFGRRLTGIVSAGLVVSTFTFLNKLSTALGGLSTSTVLNIAGYDAGAVQTTTVLMAIVLCMVIPTFISDICSYIAMRKYPIDERKTPDEA